MFPALLTTVLFSISAIVGSRIARIMSGTEVNFWRLCLASVFLGVVSYIWGIGLAGVAAPIFFISGCIGFGVGDLALFQCYPRLGPRLTIMLVHCLAALFAALIEFFWLGTLLTGKQILGSVTILAGVALALAPGKHLTFSRGQLAVGIAFGVLAAFGQGFGAVISRKAFDVAAVAGQSTAGMLFGINAAFQRVVGGVVVSGLFLLFVKRRSIAAAFGFGEGTEPTSNWRKVFPLLILNTLAGPTLGVSCYQWALSELPTGVVLPIVAMTPLVVIPFTALFEGEKLEKRSVMGAVLAVAGVLIMKFTPEFFRYLP